MFVQQMIDLGTIRFYKMRFLDKQRKVEKYFPLIIISKPNKGGRWVILFSVKILSFVSGSIIN